MLPPSRPVWESFRTCMPAADCLATDCRISPARFPFILRRLYVERFFAPIAVLLGTLIVVLAVVLVTQ
jgi:hypothetical protein